MENKLNLYQRLNEAMKIVCYVQKEGQNPNQKYKYATHDAVTKKAREALIEVGVKAIPSDVSVEKLQDPNGKSTTTLLKMVVDFVNIDNPEDHREIYSFGEGTDPQDKGIGKAKSYALKYAYLKILGLETGTDPEEDSIDRFEKTNTKTNIKTKENVVRNIKRIINLLKNKEELIEKIVCYLEEKGIQTLDEAPMELLRKLETKIMALEQSQTLGSDCSSQEYAKKIDEGEITSYEDYKQIREEKYEYGK